MKRRYLVFMLALAVPTFVGCSATHPTAASTVSRVPTGFEPAEGFVGGAWISAPAPVDESEPCAPSWDGSKSNARCYNVTVQHDFGCKKGFAFKYRVLDSYGDLRDERRERIETLGKDTPVSVRITVTNFFPGDEVKIQSGACISS